MFREKIKSRVPKSHFAHFTMEVHVVLSVVFEIWRRASSSFDFPAGQRRPLGHSLSRMPKKRPNRCSRCEMMY